MLLPIDLEIRWMCDIDILIELVFLGMTTSLPYGARAILHARPAQSIDPRTRVERPGEHLLIIYALALYVALLHKPGLVLDDIVMRVFLQLEDPLKLDGSVDGGKIDELLVVLLDEAHFFEHSSTPLLVHLSRRN